MRGGWRAHRRGRVALWGVVWVCAVAVHSFRAAQECVANPDLIRTVEQAQGLAAQPLETLRREAFHPLQAAAGWMVHAWVGSCFTDDRAAWLWAMRIVGIAAGSVVTVQVGLLARMLGARFWTAVAAAILWMVGRRTSAYGADGLSDMLALALFGGAMLAAMRSMRFRASFTGRQAALLFAAGVLSGLAYLARPEGLGAALIVVLALLVQMGERAVDALRHWACRGRRDPSRAGRWFKLGPAHPPPLAHLGAALGCVIAGALLVALPYMLLIGDVTLKKPLLGMTTAATAASGAPTGRSKIATELGETLGYGPWVVILVAIVLSRRLWGRPRLRGLVILWLVLWVAVMEWLLHRRDGGYLSDRHTLPMVMLLCAMTGLALDAWRRAIRWIITRGDAPPSRGALSWWATGLVFIAGAFPGLVELGHAPRADKMELLAAAKWVARHVRPGVPICDEQCLVGYYSGHPYRMWLGAPWQIEALRRESGGPVLLGRAYALRGGDDAPTAVETYQRIAAFTSPVAGLHGEHEMYVLYARPGEPVLKESTPPASLPGSQPSGG